MEHPLTVTDTRLRLGRRSRRTALAGSRALFVEYRVGGHTYYGVVLRQCKQLLHVYPPPPSVLALVDTDHHDILNLGWEDFELEYETVDAKYVVEARQTNQEIEQLNEQLFQQSGGHGHEQEKHGGGGTGSSRCPDTDPLNVASTHLVCTKENTPTNVFALTPTPKKSKATQPKMSTSKQTTLGSFPNFEKHAEKLSNMKPKAKSMTTSKQTTLGSFPNFEKHAEKLINMKPKAKSMEKHAEKLINMKPKAKSMTTPKKQTTLDSFVILPDGALIQLFSDGSVSIVSESWNETF